MSPSFGNRATRALPSMASRSSTLRPTKLDLDTADNTTDLPCTAMSASSPMPVCIPLCAVSSRILTLYTVVRTPEDAAHSSKQPFDYVLLCVKALPDVYDIANIIESVVAPQHTCILMNTTHSIGVESYLEQRFPTNVVLSLVSGAEIVQLGASEFEHKGATDIWVGPANKNAAIPAQIQSDMAEALSMTLSSGQVDCQVSPNIRQQQYERMIGFVLLLFLMLS
jgi:ketopantoate reductase